ncbi:MAG: bifunctional 4-hydroxy-2-oxoglutarate aldolase/2-dehydro-3-deoxy-phosphogluconate aldolase [Synechococcales cyanobacterium C42_A2020_086]|nr:bifunctional 4-hydroxy-2-oxoglutarate aldolase/2-dehydro-3-deoxy-phosphogluconate aldolase [Synechococcales cyanobacterium C42_A2020_086]
MNRTDTWLSQLQQQRAIAVIRAKDVETGVQMARAVAAGGMRLIEVTWNSTEPAKLLHQLQNELPTCTIGAGTLLTLTDLQAAITAGAEFVFSPHTSLPFIQTAQQHHLPVIPGALTPTEILTAWQAGATCVKVFPIQSVGGADYLRHLQGPLGAIPMIPTGGVTLENARALINAGAIAVGLAGQLFPKAAVQQQNWQAVTQAAQTLMQRLHSAE